MGYLTSNQIQGIMDTFIHHPLVDQAVVDRIAEIKTIGVEYAHGLRDAAIDNAEFVLSGTERKRKTFLKVQWGSPAINWRRREHMEYSDNSIYLSYLINNKKIKPNNHLGRLAAGAFLNPALSFLCPRSPRRRRIFLDELVKSEKLIEILKRYHAESGKTYTLLGCLRTRVEESDYYSVTERPLLFVPNPHEEARKIIDAYEKSVKIEFKEMMKEPPAAARQDDPSSQPKQDDYDKI